ncbi:hypothetical protein [Denitrobaculum tricleocarpae]|uniref:Uncharacterized protein n=1 Tax=Denitrobaculum tricleocarpae TaxID=2591009 RepID=A0A545T5T9_9PROT|nr:hypothetical protein [Denitrobaculum tricleocarpae]TQV72545.1 hypothetical protein FKG95_26120 [Denitrobaculum tricleocarpae]
MRIVFSIFALVVMTGAASATFSLKETRATPSPQIAKAAQLQPAKTLAVKSGACRMKLSKETEIVAFGSYQGGVRSSWDLDDSTGHETREIAVRMTSEANDVFLVLTAYDPVIWVMDPAFASRVSGVLVLGYHGQAVANLPKDTPAIISSYQSRGNSKCELWAFAHQGGKRLEDLNSRVEQVTGRPIDRFSGQYESKAVPSDVVAPHPAIEGEIRSDVRVVKLDVPNGLAGVKELVRRGKLRKANGDDLEAWLAAATERSSTGHLAPVPRPQALILSQTYVILENVRLPKGLHGKDSATFFISPGVTEIKNPGGRGDFYDIGTGADCSFIGREECPAVSR